MTRLSDRTARCLIIALVGLCVVWYPPGARADSQELDFDYDIFLVNDTLALWLDVTPVLIQSRMEDLLSGLDISVGIDLKVERPRKLFFAETLASAKATLIISHPLTEDIYRLRLINLGAVDYEFQSQLELSDFIADSVILKIGPRKQFEVAAAIRLNLNLISKSHSNNILKDISPESDKSLNRDTGGGDAFFESLFSFFLTLTGFGTTSYKIVSPPFILDDLPSF